MSCLVGSCQCGRVQYSVPYLPKEIANCHCTICHRLHRLPFVQFAKYPIKEVYFQSQEFIQIVKSSERAVRGQCSYCQTYIFMYYNQSESIWLVADTMRFDTSKIPKYNIYTDTAIIELSCNNIRLVNFRELTEILSREVPINILINPKLQHLARPENMILSFYTKDGPILISEVKYNPENQTISPPI